MSEKENLIIESLEVPFGAYPVGSKELGAEVAERLIRRSEGDPSKEKIHLVSSTLQAWFQNGLQKNMHILDDLATALKSRVMACECGSGKCLLCKTNMDLLRLAKEQTE